MTPCVVLLSTDSALVEFLTHDLRDLAQVEGVSTPGDAAASLASSPAVLVLDVRHVFDGGHAADRLLEVAQAAQQPPHVLLLSGRECPEPLERRAACSGLVHLHGDVPLQEVAAIVRAWMIRSESPGLMADASIESGRKGAPVEPGILQRFETNSAALRQMLEDLSIAAVHDVTILLIGETGSGKTYLSRLIHEASPRRNEPFLHVACGALPRELIESELFGHIKGAFTSACADKPGKFVAAGAGTILLDEIDVLGPEQQVKLLRVIETREFEPVGSNETLRLRARLVVASNLDLQPLVESGRFRPDLYYRLNMLKFELPPLRSRAADIVPLAERFIRKFAARHGVRVDRVDDRFYERLRAYPWPGNVRELEHVVQRAVIYCRDGVLTAEQLPPHVRRPHEAGAAEESVFHTPVARDAGGKLGVQVALTERDLISDALRRNNFSRTNTARDLGISRVTLYNKMKRYALLK